VSLEDAKAFNELVLNDQALFKSLYADVNDAKAFIARATAEAKQRGLSFEPKELIEAMGAEIKKRKGYREELSDQTLDGVVGGMTAVESAIDLALIEAMMLNVVKSLPKFSFKWP
jgi:hypothetical protein